MKKIILLFTLLMFFSNCFSQNPNFSKTIKIYDPDSASVYKFFKINTPQPGYKNLYIQLMGYFQGYVFDPRYKNVYRLNYLTGSIQGNLHHGILNSVFQFGTYGWEVGYLLDFAVSQTDTNLLLCGSTIAFWEPMSNVFYTKNNGDSIRQLFSSSMSISFMGAAIDPVNDSIMYLGYPTYNNTANVFKTTNRGVNWLATDTISSPAMEGKMYINPMNRNVIFLINNSILYRSTSAGYDFQPLLTDTIAGSRMAFYVPDNALYLICPTVKGILKSTNNGNNWTRIFNKPSNDLEIDPVDANIFYAGTGEGIFKSTNKGSTWFLYNNTFTPSKNILGLIKNPNSGDTLYAATGKGVYKVFGQVVMDTASPKFFPLAVGNIFVYTWLYNGFPNASGTAKVKIVKDSIINDKKYFKTYGNFPTFYTSTGLVRVDSLTGCIYEYIGSGGCGYNPTERLMDSLRARKLDTAKTCGMFDRKCYDTSVVTVFGTQTVRKDYNNLLILTAAGRSYGKNFGLLSATEGDPFITSYGLKGCVINGTVYGDTTAPADLYTISGNVLYSDNNLPATDGYVKAIKLDKATGNIITFDSVQIQANGNYTLTNIPQDSVDIGVYPNSSTQNDWVMTYYPSTIYWQSAATLYPTGNLTNINVGAIRLSSTANNNSVNGKIMRLTDNSLGNLKDAVLYAKYGSIFVRCGISDANGVYHLPHLPAVSLKIIVNRLGFTNDSTTVNLTATSNIDSVNFYLYKTFTGIKQIENVLLSEYKLYQNYPNPFNPSTNIRYQITNNKYVSLKVYNILGKEVATLVNEKQTPGVYEVTFDAGGLPSGIYFYKLQAGDFSEVKRMVLVK
ncbi:MAG: T9SS type A sorting domain-containing protein [Ignavibacteriae bacterium]|nr:T9SS type A sorting domain-containing protein [Ignavibacteriota bacterium]